MDDFARVYEAVSLRNPATFKALQACIKANPVNTETLFDGLLLDEVAGYSQDRRVGLFCVLYEIVKENKHDKRLHSTLKLPSNPANEKIIKKIMKYLITIGIISTESELWTPSKQSGPEKTAPPQSSRPPTRETKAGATSRHDGSGSAANSTSLLTASSVINMELPDPSTSQHMRQSVTTIRPQTTRLCRSRLRSDCAAFVRQVLHQLLPATRYDPPLFSTQLDRSPLVPQPPAPRHHLSAPPFLTVGAVFSPGGGCGVTGYGGPATSIGRQVPSQSVKPGVEDVESTSLPLPVESLDFLVVATALVLLHEFSFQGYFAASTRPHSSQTSKQTDPANTANADILRTTEGLLPDIGRESAQNVSKVAAADTLLAGSDGAVGDACLDSSPIAANAIQLDGGGVSDTALLTDEALCPDNISRTQSQSQVDLTDAMSGVEGLTAAEASENGTEEFEDELYKDINGRAMDHRDPHEGRPASPAIGSNTSSDPTALSPAAESFRVTGEDSEPDWEDGEDEVEDEEMYNRKVECISLACIMLAAKMEYCRRCVSVERLIRAAESVWLSRERSVRGASLPGSLGTGLSAATPPGTPTAADVLSTPNPPLGALINESTSYSSGASTAVSAGSVSATGVGSASTQSAYRGRRNQISDDGAGDDTCADTIRQQKQRDVVHMERCLLEQWFCDAFAIPLPIKMVFYWASAGQLSPHAARETLRLVHGDTFYSLFLGISHWQRERGGSMAQHRKQCLAMQFNEDALALAFVLVAVCACSVRQEDECSSSAEAMDIAKHVLSGMLLPFPRHINRAIRIEDEVLCALDHLFHHAPSMAPIKARTAPLISGIIHFSKGIIPAFVEANYRRAVESDWRARGAKSAGAADISSYGGAGIGDSAATGEEAAARSAKKDRNLVPDREDDDGNQIKRRRSGSPIVPRGNWGMDAYGADGEVRKWNGSGHKRAYSNGGIYGPGQVLQQLNLTRCPTYVRFCKEFVEYGDCRRRTCKYSHDKELLRLRKQELCPDLLRGHQCQYQRFCSYSHGEPSAPPPHNERLLRRCSPSTLDEGRCSNSRGVSHTLHQERAGVVKGGRGGSGCTGTDGSGVSVRRSSSNSSRTENISREELARDFFVTSSAGHDTEEGKERRSRSSGDGDDMGNLMNDDEDERRGRDWADKKRNSSAVDRGRAQGRDKDVGNGGSSDGDFLKGSSGGEDVCSRLTKRHRISRGEHGDRLHRHSRSTIDHGSSHRHRGHKHREHRKGQESDRQQSRSRNREHEWAGDSCEEPPVVKLANVGAASRSADQEQPREQVAVAIPVLSAGGMADSAPANITGDAPTPSTGTSTLHGGGVREAAAECDASSSVVQEGEVVPVRPPRMIILNKPSSRPIVIPTHPARKFCTATSHHDTEPQTPSGASGAAATSPKSVRGRNPERSGVQKRWGSFDGSEEGQVDRWEASTATSTTKKKGPMEASRGRHSPLPKHKKAGRAPKQQQHQKSGIEGTSDKQRAESADDIFTASSASRQVSIFERALSAATGGKGNPMLKKLLKR